MLPNLVLYEEEFNQVTDVIKRLVASANAKVIFLVDKNGQLITSAGHTEGIDTTSLASLTAGNIAATGGLAKLIGEKEFSILFHEGEKDNIHISIVGGRVILVTDPAGEAAAADGAWQVSRMPACDPVIAPIVYAIPAQLLAYHAALAKGTDVDQPRNLAKSVTVE